MADLMLYQQLTNFIRSKLPKNYQAKFYSWLENGQLIDQGGKITDNGIEILHIRYDAVLFFDEFPYREISAHKLMAWIQIWLNENDNMRCQLDYSETDFDIEIIDDKTADVNFTIKFQEPLTAIENNQGDLEVNGKKYQLMDIEIYYPTEIDVIARQVK